jgi:hypothetical protein
MPGVPRMHSLRATSEMLAKGSSQANEVVGGSVPESLCRKLELASANETDVNNIKSSKVTGLMLGLYAAGLS